MLMLISAFAIFMDSLDSSIVNVANVYADKYGMGNDDVYGLFTTIGFDIASLALNAVIFAGASLCVIPDDKKDSVFFMIQEMEAWFLKQLSCLDEWALKEGYTRKDTTNIADHSVLKNKNIDYLKSIYFLPFLIDNITLQ